MGIASPTVKGKIADYVVETMPSASGLADVAKIRLKDGYVLYGFPFPVGNNVAQAFLKYEDGAFWPEPQHRYAKKPQQKRNGYPKPGEKKPIEVKRKAYKIDRSKV